MTKPQSLGDRIAQARREKGVRDRRDITQLDVAKAIGVSGAAVSQWENDVREPREDALLKLAKFLGVSPAFLRYGVKDTVNIGGLEVDASSIRRYTDEEIEAARREAARTAAPAPQRRRKNGH